MSSYLDKLVGEELGSVAFVMDYIELDFNGPVLRLLGDISVVAPSAVDAECKHISAQLVKFIGDRPVKIDDSDNYIEIWFSNEALIRVNRSSSRGEFANFITFPGNKLIVWD